MKELITYPGGVGAFLADRCDAIIQRCRREMECDRERDNSCGVAGRARVKNAVRRRLIER